MTITPNYAVRRCSLPDCAAWYDVVAVTFAGTARADGWRTWRSLNLRLCSDHAWLWVDGAGDGPHRPGLAQVDDVVWVRCACGWELDTAGLTAGESASQYLAHLAGEVVAGTVNR